MLLGNCFILFFLIAVCYGQPANDRKDCLPFWRYQGTRGQRNWCCIGIPECCKQYQSPINIEISSTQYDRNAACLKLHNYHCRPKAMALHNNGQTLELAYNAHKNTTTPYVTGGPIRNSQRYILDRIIFHWGSVSTQGSEHSLDSVSMPMEMQLLHRNSKYSSMSEAMKNRDGIVIIAVLFLCTKCDNNNLRDIVYNLEYVKWLGQTKTVSPFPVQQLIPKPYSSYYSYEGSLSFPPCSAVVTWIVFHNPLPISEQQLNEFRKLQDTNKEQCPKQECPMVDNFRGIQCIKNRIVRWKEECTSNNICHD